MRRQLGHIEQRGNSWSIKVSLGKDATGKPRYQTATVRGSKKDAEKKLSDMLHLASSGAITMPGKVTLAEYLKRWHRDYVAPNLSPRTAEGYQHIINKYVAPKLGNHILTSLKPEHLQQFYAAEVASGLSNQTVRHFHMLLHKSLDNAVEWGLLTRNVSDAVKPPKAQRTEMLTWNEAELTQFLEVAKTSSYYELFYLFLFTGLRRSEALALRWSDVDLLYGQISVSRSLHVLKGSKVIFRQPKTASGRRTIALSPSSSIVLSEYRHQKEVEALMLGISLSDSALIFNTLGSPLLPNSVSHAWEKMVKRSGLKKIRLHDSRHTHASIMLRLGVHPKIVSERLGHSSIQITLDTYSHVAPGLQEAAAQKFDDLIQIKHNEKALSSI